MCSRWAGRRIPVCFPPTNAVFLPIGAVSTPGLELSHSSELRPASRCLKGQMRRIRWFDPDKDDPSSPVAWRAASLVTATLFLNFSFTFQAAGLWQFCALPLYALFLGILALLLTGLFFIGPALAIRAAERPLFLVIEDSLGSIPAFGVRFCCASFLVLWMATLIAFPMILLSNDLERKVSSTELGIIAAAVVMFLFFTGQQSFQNKSPVGHVHQ